MRVKQHGSAENVEEVLDRFDQLAEKPQEEEEPGASDYRVDVQINAWANRFKKLRKSRNQVLQPRDTSYPKT